MNVMTLTDEKYFDPEKNRMVEFLGVRGKVKINRVVKMELSGDSLIIKYGVVCGSDDSIIIINEMMSTDGMPGISFFIWPNELDVDWNLSRLAKMRGVGLGELVEVIKKNQP